MQSRNAAPRRKASARDGAITFKVSGAFHSPLVAHAGRRLKPAVDKVRFHDPIAPFMSTVTAKIEPAARLGSLLVDQLTAPVRFTQATVSSCTAESRPSSRSAQATCSRAS